MQFYQSFKRLLPLGFVSFWMFTSCINSDYDLSKGVNKDMQVGAGGISLPVGTTEPIMLSQLIGESDLIVLEDGYYSVRKPGEVSQTKVDISPVSFKSNLFPVQPVLVDFSIKKIDDLEISDFQERISLKSSDITMDKLHFEPLRLDKTMKGAALPSGPSTPVAGERISGSVQTDCRFNFTLPQEIDRMSRIYFGNSEKGQLMTLRIDISSVLSAMKPTAFSHTLSSLELLFPDEFVLAPAPDRLFSPEMKISGNRLIIKDALLSATEGLIQIGFYVNSFKSDLSGLNFDFNGKVDCNFDYVFSGETVDNPTTPRVHIYMEEQLVLQDADIRTSEIPFTYPQAHLQIQGQLTELGDIRKIKKVFFKNTSLGLTVSDPRLPFPVSGGKFIHFDLPPMFEYDFSDLPAGFQIEGTRLLIPSDQLFGLNLDLRLISADLSAFPVSNQSLSFSDDIACAGGELFFQGAEARLSELDHLTSIRVDWGLKGGMLSVGDAEVETDVVETIIETDGEIKVDEVVPDELKLLHQLYPQKNKAPNIRIHLDMEGDFPSGVEWLTLENVQVHFPEFILFDDERVVGQVLTLNGRFHVSQGYDAVLQIAGMDFLSYTSGNGLEPVTVNGEKRIRITENNRITVSGKVKCDGVSLNMNDLKNIQVKPVVTMDEFPLGVMRGVLTPEIGMMGENVSFDLGEELAFLKDDAVMNLSNPQFFLKVANTMGVPLDVTMDMIAYDKEGAVVEGSRISQIAFKLDGAEVNGEETFTKVLVSRLPLQKEGFQNVVVPDLSNLFTVLPESIDIEMNACADEASVHEIDLSLESDKYVTGDYEVVIPLRFESLSLNYVESIDGLKETFRKISDNQEELVIELKTSVLNSIPLDLELSVVGRDTEGVIIGGVKSTRAPIHAGGSPDDEPVETKVVLEITVEKGAFPLLETLDLKIYGNAGEEQGEVSLRDDQYVQLNDIRLKVLGGININF
ncbi:MAG: hypothetical protein ACRCSQ_02820 [Bacteroidales bacterium]